MLENTPDQLSKFWTKNWIDINDQSRGVYSTGSDIRIKKSMQNPSLCDYCDAYILVKGTTTIIGSGHDAAAKPADKKNKGLMFENYAPFTNCKSETNNTEIDNTKDIDIVMPMYNLIEYSNNYSKTSPILRQYYRDELNDNLADSESFKSKVEITGGTPVGCNTKDIEIIVP